MPNTLVHFGVQGLIWRGYGGKPGDLNWVFLGAVIPDMPWIIRHAVSLLIPGLDAYDLVLYATVQASLMFCLVLAAGLSLFSNRPRVVFLVLALNSLIHLLLDASEIKWANGVHLIAPFSWQLSNWGLVWPESIIVSLATIFGLGVTLWALVRTGRGELAPNWPHPRRLLAGMVIIAAYLLLPLTQMSGPYEADNHSVKTLREEASRTGKAVIFDRQRLYDVGNELMLRTFANEDIVVVASPPASPGIVSMRGHFVDLHTVVVDEIHYHHDWFRDGASYVGLLLFLLLWLGALWRSTTRSHH